MGPGSLAAAAATMKRTIKSIEVVDELTVKVNTTSPQIGLSANHTVFGMLTLLSALGSLLSFRVRSRLTLELELVALQHQLTVLRRQRPGRHHRYERRAA